MPSVASSLNQGSSNSLLEIMQQRLLEQEMQKQLFAQQRQQQQDMIGTGMRMQSHDLAERRLRSSEAARAATAEAAARKEAAAARKAENERGVALMAGEHIKSGQATRASIAPMAMQSGGRVQSWMVPEAEKPKETPAERHARIVADKVSGAEGEAAALKKFPELRPKGPKEPKPPADEIKAPPGLRDEIEHYASSKFPGWRTVDDARDSIEANWPKIRAKYGKNLDRAAVDKVLANIYGTRPKSKDGRQPLVGGD